MDLKQLVGALARWWLLAVAVALLSAGAGFMAFTTVQPTYTSVTSAVLIPPQSSVSNGAKTSIYAPPNPLLYLGGLTQSRDIVIGSLNSSDVAAGVAAEHPTATVQASPAFASSGPLVVVTASAPTPSESLAAMTMVGNRMTVTLADIQDRLGIARDNRITSLVLTTDKVPEISRKSQLQLTILATVGVALAGFFLLALWDNLMTSRRRASVVLAASAPDPAQTPQRELDGFSPEEDRASEVERDGRGGRTPGLRAPSHAIRSQMPPAGRG